MYDDSYLKWLCYFVNKYNTLGLGWGLDNVVLI